MSRETETPHLRTYTVRFAPFYGIDLDTVRVEAQGFHETDDGHLELWRYIPAGERQIVARFQSTSVVDIFEDADALAPDSVPAEWARSYASDEADEARAVTPPPPPSDDDVPF